MRKKEQWASCYRQQSFINTNMHVEAFHHVLKYIYLNGKVNKRVDNCIHTLLKIIRDKNFERIIKLTKGKKTKKVMEIQKRHNASKNMTTASIREIEEGIWDVQASSNDTRYRVAVDSTICAQTCMLRCTVFYTTTLITLNHVGFCCTEMANCAHQF